MEYYFNYMGMLAEEGSYDSLDALVQSESLRQTLPGCCTQRNLLLSPSSKTGSNLLVPVTC